MKLKLEITRINSDFFALSSNLGNFLTIEKYDSIGNYQKSICSKID